MAGLKLFLEMTGFLPVLDDAQLCWQYLAHQSVGCHGKYGQGKCICKNQLVQSVLLAQLSVPVCIVINQHLLVKL